MSNYKMLLVATIIFFISNSSIAQSKRYNNWYFAKNAGITFNTISPSPLTDVTFPQTGATGESSSNISDKYGRSLFYSDGNMAWNMCGYPMPNGTGLATQSSATQGVLITPYIDGNGVNDKKYYIFNIAALEGGLPGIHYSIIDMDLDHCRGDVIDTIKNIPLLVNDSLYEKLTAVKHANGIDYWLITRMGNGSSRYVSFLIDSSGISAPVYSDAGFKIMPAPVPFTFLFPSYPGYIRASPNGEKIVCAIFNFGGASESNLELVDFNDSTGKVSNPIELSKSIGRYPYGVEFSPNSSYVYTTISAKAPAVLDTILRYKIYDSMPSNTESFVGYGNGAMLLGPDKKIYLADVGTFIGGADSMLSIIANPNDSIVSNIQFQKNVVDLAGRKVLGLPNLFYYYTKEDTSLIPPIDKLPYAGLLDSIYIDTCIGELVQLGIPDTNCNCRKYAWTFSSGLDDSTLAQPTASLPGTYIVNVDYKCNYSDTVVLWTADTLISGISNDTSICFGTDINLVASGGLTYNWSPAGSLDTINGDSVIASPLDTTIYQVIIEASSCPSDTQYVTVNVLFGDSTWLYPDTSLCPGTPISFYAISKGFSSDTSSPSYLWTPGNYLDDPNTLTPTFLSDSLLNDTTIRYSLATVGNGCGLLIKDYVDIIILNALISIEVPDDTTICEGNEVQLFANVSGGIFQDWQPNISLSNNLISNPIATTSTPTTYTVNAQNQCKSVSESVLINALNCSLYIPNAFSPNGDGDNDVFRILGGIPSKYSLKIYDRWGNKVFNSKNINDIWNGTNRNEGVYVYRLEITFTETISFEKTGAITLVR